MRAIRYVRRLWTRGLCCCVIMSWAASPTLAASSYSLTALPEVAGDVTSDAYGVHVDGEGVGLEITIVGRSSSAGGVHHSVVWNSGADLGAASVTPLGTTAPGVSSEARAVRCADGTCYAVGDEGAENAGRAPVAWNNAGGAWGPPVALTCPAQTQPATPDVGFVTGVATPAGGSSFAVTVCGACDVTEGAVGAVRQATVWEEQAGGTWISVPLPGLSLLADASSEAAAIFLLPVPAGERLVAAGWAEDDLRVRQPVIWERSAAGWSIQTLPLPAGSRGGEVRAGDFGVAGQAFVLDGTRSVDDGTVRGFHWTQVSGPFGTPPTWDGQDLLPLSGHNRASMRAVAGRRGASRRASLAASYNVMGVSSGGAGLPPKATLWEVYPHGTETHDFEAVVRDVPGTVIALEIQQSVRGVVSGSPRVAIGTATTTGPLAFGGSTSQGAEETHAVALVQNEPAPGLMPAGIILALVVLAMAGAAAVGIVRGEELV